MNWVVFFFAVLSALAAVLFLWGHMSTRRELALMRATSTSGARDIANMAPGTLVEVKGTLRTAAALTSDLSGRECVYYRSLTEREVQRTTTNSDGKRESSPEFEVVSDVVRFAPATVEDATGSVAVDFKDAKVESEQVMMRREAASLGESLLASLAGAGTMAQRYTEWIVAAGIPIYVLGTVTAAHAIGADPARRNPFVISIKSEEERDKSLGRLRMWQMVAIAGFAILAAVLFLVAFTSGPVQTTGTP
jgi:hypothetical protein